jgi:PEP-CTERM motif-containing protein
MKARYLFLSVLAATALPIPGADAAVLLTFGQTHNGNSVTGTRVGTSDTITSDTTVDIDEIDAPVVTPTSAIFTLTATNTGPATIVGSNIEQHYSGKFSITSGATNYLSGTFSDAVFGSGGALTLSASNVTPGESVTFTSNVIAPSLIAAFDRSASLSLTDVSPSAAIVLGTLNSFKSDVGGDFSATVPEPSTWAMMVLSFAALGYVGFRKARSRSAISIA